MRRARAPRAREPWGKRPNGPAARYVRLFVAAVVVVALFGRLKASRDVASPASDAMALTSTTARREELVFDASTLNPRGFARDPTHVHLPRGGYLVAWAGVNARAGRGARRGRRSAPHVARRLVPLAAPLAPARRRHTAPLPILRRRPPPPPFLADGAPRRHPRTTPRDPPHNRPAVQPAAGRARGERRVTRRVAARACPSRRRR